MNIISLPKILLKNNSDASKSPFFYYHIGHQEFYKSKISFTQHCIAFLLTGKKRVLHQDKELIYDNSSCLLFKAGNYVSNEIATDGAPYHSILMFFDNAQLKKLSFKHQPSKRPLIKAYSTSEIAVPTTPYIKSYLESLKQLLSSGHFSEHMAHIKFEEIMLHLLECYGGGIIQYFDSPMENSREALFRKIIDTNINRNASIEELAFLCNMSVSTFRRQFIEIYQCSPGIWLQERRLDYAAYQLKAQGKSSSEIFEDVGYSSLSSFINSFKRQFGVTPKRYQLSN